MRVTVVMLLLFTSLSAIGSSEQAMVRPLPQVYLKTLEFRGQLNKAMAGQEIDYQQLRQGYFELYGAYVDEPFFGTIIEQLETTTQYQEYMDLGGLARVSTYADIGTHDYLARMMTKHGNADLAAKHLRVKNGLVAAVRRSATGATVEQPLRMISVREMHDYIAANNWREERLESIDTQNGKVMKAVVKDASGSTKSLYFSLPKSNSELPDAEYPPVMWFVDNYLSRVDDAKVGHKVDFDLLRWEQRLLTHVLASSSLTGQMERFSSLNDYKNLQILMDYYLEMQFVDALAHYTANLAAKNLNEPERAKQHLTTSAHLHRSISASGDGSSVEKSLVFYSSLESTNYMTTRGLEITAEEDLTGKVGGDKLARVLLTVKKKSSGELQKLYVQYELMKPEYYPMLPRLYGELPQFVVDLSREKALVAVRKGLNGFTEHASFSQIGDLSVNKEQGKASITFHLNGVVPLSGKSKGTPPCSGLAIAKFTRNTEGHWYLNSLGISEVRDKKNGQCFNDFTYATAMHQFVSVK